MEKNQAQNQDTKMVNETGPNQDTKEKDKTGPNQNTKEEDKNGQNKSVITPLRNKCIRISIVLILYLSVLCLSLVAVTIKWSTVKELGYKVLIENQANVAIWILLLAILFLLGYIVYRLIIAIKGKIIELRRIKYLILRIELNPDMYQGSQLDREIQMITRISEL